MKNLNKLFPLSYKAKTGNDFAGAVTIYILAYFVGDLLSSVLSFLYNLLTFLPDFLLKVLSFFMRVVNLLGGFVSVYAMIGLVLAFLVFRKIAE